MPEFDAKAHVAHMTKMLQLTIAPEWEPSVVANLQATARSAALLMEFPLEEHIEPAPVFEP